MNALFGNGLDPSERYPWQVAPLAEGRLIPVRHDPRDHRHAVLLGGSGVGQPAVGWAFFGSQLEIALWVAEVLGASSLVGPKAGPSRIALAETWRRVSRAVLHDGLRWRDAETILAGAAKRISPAQRLLGAQRHACMMARAAMEGEDAAQPLAAIAPLLPEPLSLGWVGTFEDLSVGQDGAMVRGAFRGWQGTRRHPAERPIEPDDEDAFIRHLRDPLASIFGRAVA
jgi:hypothetical protein